MPPFPSSSLAPVNSGACGLALKFRRGPLAIGRDDKPLLPIEPRRGSSFAAGLDLFMAQDETIPRRGTIVVDTQMRFLFPPEIYGQLALRSSAALLGIILLGGVVGKHLARARCRQALINPLLPFQTRTTGAT